MCEMSLGGFRCHFLCIGASSCSTLALFQASHPPPRVSLINLISDFLTHDIAMDLLSLLYMTTPYVQTHSFSFFRVSIVILYARFMSFSSSVAVLPFSILPSRCFYLCRQSLCLQLKSSTMMFPSCNFDGRCFQTFGAEQEEWCFCCI